MVDHSFDHLASRTTWKQCEREHPKASFSDSKVLKSLVNQGKKSVQICLGRRCRRFESCHSDHLGSEKRFSEPFSLPSATQILRADDCFRQPSALSFLINHKLGIFAVFLISADEKEIHISGNAKTTVTAEFAFKLISEIGSIIIKEFHLLSVRKRVFHIDITAHKEIECFDLRHSFDMQIVKFTDKLLFEFLEVFITAKLRIAFPIVELGKMFVKISSCRFSRPIFIRHMTDQEVGQFFKACITEIAVGIAPLAVFLVEKSVWFFADVSVLKRHTAALADKISR